MGEEPQVLTRSGRLVDGEGLKHRSGSPCRRGKKNISAVG